MNALGIRAGRAFVELTANDGPLRQALAQWTGRLAQWATKVQSVAARAGATGGILGAPLVKAITDAASRGRNIGEMASALGLTTERVSGLAYAFETVRVPLDEFEGVLDGLAGKVRAAADANGELHKNLVGMRGRDLIDKNILDTLLLVTDRFKRIENPIDQLTAAEELFGAAGKRLLPILKQGAEGFRRLHDDAARGGFLVTAREAEESVLVMKAANAVWSEFGAIVRAVGFALLPAGDETRSVTQKIHDAGVAVRDWVRENAGLVATVAKVTAGLVVASPVLFGVAQGVKMVSAGIGLTNVALGATTTALRTVYGALGIVRTGFMALWSVASIGSIVSAGVGALTSTVGLLFAAVTGGVAALGSGLALLVTPFGVVIAGLAAITAGTIAWVRHAADFSRTFEGFGGRIARAFDFTETGARLTAFAGTAREAFGVIKDAIGRGDWAGAFKVLTAGAKSSWAEMTHFLVSKWIDLKGIIVEGWYELVGKLQEVKFELAIAAKKLDPFGSKEEAERLDKALADFKADRAAKLAIDRAGRDKAREADKAESKEGADAARKEFEDAVTGGKADAMLAPFGEAMAAIMHGALEEIKAAGVATTPGRAAMAAWRPSTLTDLFSGAKGTFAGPSGQQLGYGDNVGQRQLDVQKDIAKHTAPIAPAVMALAKALVFK